MINTIKYQPDESVSFNDTLILFGTARQKVRNLLSEKFEVADKLVDLSSYNNGDTSKNIIQRRDIYKRYHDQENFFFLNYDVDERLTEIEVHHGFYIKIENVVIDFSMNIEDVANLIDSVSGDKKELSDEEYFFKNLKLLVASSSAMGGDGSDLSYFYCSNDITHLLDDEA